MKITLATHIVVEHVGNQVFLLDSVGKEVYCLPAEGISHYTPETKTLVVTPELVPEVTRLVDSGVATTTGLISRRAVVGSTGALIGGGLVAMSMPAAAASQSPSSPGEEHDFEASGLWKYASDDALDINIDLAGIAGLVGDPSGWTLKIFNETYDLGEDVDCLELTGAGLLVISDLESVDENAGLLALRQEFGGDPPDGTVIFATLEAGNLTGKIRLTYDRNNVVTQCGSDS